MFCFVYILQDTSNWPLIDPLPSYGRGRELPGGRYMSLIHGIGLEDVVITGAYLKNRCIALLYEMLTIISILNPTLTQLGKLDM